MNEILLIGAGGHAHACISVIELLHSYEIKGFVDNNKLIGSSILGYKVVGKDSDLLKLRQKYKNALITIGQIKTPQVRIALYNLLKELANSLTQSQSLQR